MDPEAARQRLEQLGGYVHPTNPSYSKNHKYKTFSDNDTKQKSNINGFKSTEVKGLYGTNTAAVQVTDDTCPICKEKAVIVCPCGYSDKQCSNGHSWYYDREGILKRGKPH
jgi:hypothetical protein